MKWMGYAEVSVLFLCHRALKQNLILVKNCVRFTHEKIQTNDFLTDANAFWATPAF